MTKQRGFTLVELMVGIVVGMIVIAAALAMYITSMASGRDALRSAHLNHELEAVMDIMSADARRAGYWNSEASAATSNPFTASSDTNLNLATAGCLLYAYDRDADGSVGDTERYGFRLDTAGGVGIVRMRESCDPTAGSCDSCAAGSWEAVSDETAVSVDRLTFTPNPNPFKCKEQGTVNTACPSPLTTGDYVETRQIDIVLTGHLVSDPSVYKTIQASVKVRNDRLINVP